MRWLTEALPAAAAVAVGTTHVLSLGPLDLFVAWLARQDPQASLRQVIAFSSTSVATKIASTAVQERLLARRLSDSEATLQRECTRLGVDWTLLRPTLIYGGKDDLVARIGRFAARWHVHPHPVDALGRALRQPVHAADLALATVNVIDNPAALNRGFDLPGGETLSLAQLIGRSARANGNPSLPIPAPLSALLGISAATGLLPASTALTSASMARIAQDQVFDPGPARLAFGFAPRPFQPGSNGPDSSDGTGL